MFCQSCGKEIKDGSKFCKYCGSEVKNKGTLSKAPNKPTNANDDDGSKKLIIGALVVVIIILAALIGVFGLGLMGDDGGSVSDPASLPASDSSPSSVSDSGSSSNNQPASDTKDPVSLSSFPVSRAPELAQAVKDSNGNFPVQFESLSLSKAQCVYILTKSVAEIGSGHPDATFSVGNPAYASNPSGSDSHQSIASANYVDMSKRFSTWIESNGQVPNYVGIYSGGVPDVSPSRMLDIAVNVLLQYDNTGSLPSNIKI